MAIAMKPGDEVVGGGWITATAQTASKVAVYVSPPGEWRWGSDVELTGVSIPAVARELEPTRKRALIHFLLLQGCGTMEVVRAADVARPTVTKEKKRLGLRLGVVPDPKWDKDRERRKERKEQKREQTGKE